MSDAATPAQAAPTRLAVIVASTREGRRADVVADWVVARLAEHPEVVVDVVDLRDVELPAVLGAGHPKQGDYAPAVAAFAERIGAAEAFLFVVPEYNHGYPASLKLALDVVYAEWLAKPASFVSYGGVSGGIRAQEQLRQVLGELHVVDIRDSLPLPFFAGDLDEEGRLTDVRGSKARALAVVVRSLTWWAVALREAKERRPYPG